MNNTLAANAVAKLLLANRRPTNELNRHEATSRGMRKAFTLGLVAPTVAGGKAVLTDLGREVANGFTSFDPRTGEAKINFNRVAKRYGGDPLVIDGTTFQIEAL